MTLLKADGTEIPLRSFTRKLADGALRFGVAYRDADMLNRHVIRSICAALRIDPADVDPTYDGTW